MGKREWLLLGSALPALALIALLAWASAKFGGNPGGLGINRTFGEVSIANEPARDFSLDLIDGGTLTLSDQRGKVVMLNFWASWCPPCRTEAPVLERIYQEYAGQPVEFIGVDIWDRREDALEFIKEYGVTYPNGIDEKGSILIDYGVTGIPETLFIGCDGILAKKLVGPIEAAKLQTTLDHLVSTDPTCGIEPIP